MTKLPGLTRHDDRPSVDGANRGRVQVRNPIGDVAIQPQARPVDTYSRPMAPPSGPNGLQQLAGALAQISPALTNFLDTSAAKSKKDAEDRAMRRIGGMSFQEARTAVDSGEMSEMQNPWFKAAFMKQYGERLAYERVNELTKEYETNFDKNSGDLDSFIRERTAADLEQYGQNPHFTGAYNNVMDGFATRANSTQVQYQTKQVKLDTLGGVYETFLGQAKTMLGDGKNPQEVVQALRGNYDGNRSLLHVDFREQDKEMVRLAEAFANEGNLGMVKAILGENRVGTDGTVLGPLSANREFQTDAQRILMNARSRMEENNGEAAFNARMTFSEQARSGNLDQAALLTYREKNPGAFTDAQALSLIGQNDSFKERQAELAANHEHRLTLAAESRASEANLLAHNMEAAQTGMLPYLEEASVLTETGDTRSVSIEDQKKAVASEVIRQTDWLVKNGKATPDAAFARQVEAFTANNLENPEWASVLSAGYLASTPFTNSGGNSPAQLEDGAALYMRLHAANRALLDRHIKNSATRDFYEQYRIATQYGRQAHAQALQTATAIMADPEAAQARAKISNEAIDEVVSGVQYGGDWYKLWQNKAPPSNQGYVASEIGRLAKFYAKNSLSPDDALAEAKSRFLDTHTEVAGNYIYTAGKDIPSNFGDMAKQAIEKYTEDFGEAEGVEADDLTIRPATNGYSWLIVHKMGQFPVENSGRANLSLRSLRELDQARQVQLKQGVIEEQERQQKDRAAGIGPYDRIFPPVEGGLFTGDLHEAIRKRDEEDRQKYGGAAEFEVTDDSMPSQSWLDTILPPVEGGLFSGNDYERLNRSSPDQD